MRILIIAHDFPPINRVASLRPFSWAKYWSRAGHDICVLTVQAQSFSAPLNLSVDHKILDTIRIEAVSYLSLKSNQAQAFRITQNQHSEYQDCDRQILKSSTQNSIQKQSGITYIYGFARRFLRKVSEWLGTGSFLYASVLWILPALKSAKQIYQEWPFDIVVSTFGPPACHIIAGLLKQQFPIYWVADYRDLWHGSHLVTAKWPFSQWERAIENYFVSQADLITTVSEPLKQSLKQRFSQEICTIENGFDTEELPLENQNVFPEDGKVRLVYTGLFYPGKQDISPLWEAITLLKKQGVDLENSLEILFYGPDFSSLSQSLEAYALKGICKLAGFVSRSQALQIQHSADALIFLEWTVPQVEGILTGKLFEYLFSGRPILGIGATHSTTAGQVLAATGTGFPLGTSAERLAELLQQLLARNSLPYNPNQQVLQHYTRENLAQRMLGCMRRS